MLPVVVGENLGRSYKETLASKELEIVEALAEKIENDSLRILIPRRTVHSKLYILEKPGMVQVINGSANLTETAQSASNQINYVWYWDLPVDHPLISKFTQDYNAHTKRCSVFMEDLFKLFKKVGDTSRSQVIEAWLTGTVATEGSQVTTKILGEVTARALDHVDTTSQPVFSLNLSGTPTERRDAQQALKKLGIKAVGDAVEVNRREVFDYVEKTINVPLMAVDVEQSQVRLAMNGSLHILNEEPTDTDAISRALAHLERYINTVDLGQSPDPLVA
jgi:hypothetical protein